MGLYSEDDIKMGLDKLPNADSAQLRRIQANRCRDFRDTLRVLNSLPEITTEERRRYIESRLSEENKPAILKIENIRVPSN